MNIKIILLGVIVAIVVVVGIMFLPRSEEFSAIKSVQAEISPEKQEFSWYKKIWSQEPLTETTWKVAVGAAIWQVSETDTLCSQAGRVDICSASEDARTYSGLPACEEC